MKKITRRSFLQAAGVSAAAAALAACGGSTSSTVASSAAASTAASSAAAVSNWPEGDVTVYIPAAAGGGSDTVCRQFTERMKTITGGNFVVVNDTTGGNSVAYETVRNATPDGLTLLGYHGGLCSQYSSGQYEHSLDEFTVCGNLTSADNIGYGIFVNGKSEIETFDDFIKYAQEHPGELTVGVEINNLDHLMAVMMEDRFDCSFSIVSAGSNSEKIPLLIGGNVDMLLLSPSGGVPDYVTSGDLKCLALSSDVTMDDQLPGVPCFADLGYETMLMPMFFYLAGPADMPQETVQAINDVLKQISEDSTIYEVLENYAMNWTYNTVEEAQANAHAMQETYDEAFALLNANG